MRKTSILYLTFALIISFFTGCTDLFIMDISSDRVETITPQEGIIFKSGEITFAWKTLEGTEKYHIVVASPSFDRIERYVYDEIIDGCVCYLSLPTGDYQWHVEGINYAYTSEIEIISFKVTDNEK